MAADVTAPLGSALFLMQRQSYLFLNLTGASNLFFIRHIDVYGLPQKIYVGISSMPLCDGANEIRGNSLAS